MGQAARFSIAVTDKNPHVREFLCRELEGLGHRAVALRDAGEILACLSGVEAPQVLVLDPEAAGPRLGEVLKRLAGQAGRVRVVLHVFAEDPLPELAGAVAAEKRPGMDALLSALSGMAAQGEGGDA